MRHTIGHGEARMRPLFPLWLLMSASLIAQAPSGNLPLSPNYVALKRTDGHPILDFEGSKKLLARIDNVAVLSDLGKEGILLISVKDGNAASKRRDLAQAVRDSTDWTVLPVYEQGRHTYIPKDTMSVRFHRGVKESTIESLVSSLGCRILRKPADPAGEWKIASTQRDRSRPEKLVEQFRKHDSVEWADIDFLVLSNERTPIRPLPPPPKR